MQYSFPYFTFNKGSLSDYYTKMKFSIKDFFSKYDQIRRKSQITM